MHRLRNQILIFGLSFLSIFSFGQEMSFWQLELFQDRIDRLSAEKATAFPVVQTFSHRTVGDREGFELYNPEVFWSFNSKNPSGRDDGAIWQGRGLNSRVSAGVEYFTDYLYISFVPEAWIAQNLSSAAVAGSVETKDYASGLDRPQRFGTQPYSDWSLGQSNIRFLYKGFGLGFSTENIKTGPGLRNSIILSDNADGFPHIDVGTDTPWETFAGAIQFKFLWAQLYESDFFDDDSSNDIRFFTGGSLAYSPSFLEGLTVGVNRYFQSPWDTINGFKVFEFFIDTVWKTDRYTTYDTETGEDDVDQVLSFTFEWCFPSVGFELYGEWARNDHSKNLLDFLMQPDHSAAYVLGFLKKTPSFWDGDFILNVEFTDLGNNIGTVLRPTGAWYRHNSNPQGYTHNGQGLGAGIGTGSNSQYFGIMYSDDSWGFVSFGVERICWDNDYFYKHAEANGWSYGDYYLTIDFEAKALYMVTKRLSLYSAWVFSKNYNYAWGDDTVNLYVSLGSSLKI